MISANSRSRAEKALPRLTRGRKSLEEPRVSAWRLRGAFCSRMLQSKCSAVACWWKYRLPEEFLSQGAFCFGHGIFLVLFAGVGVESNPKRRIIAGCRVSRFSYLSFLNTFMGVLCFSYSLPKMLHAVLLFLLNSCHI